MSKSILIAYDGSEGSKAAQGAGIDAVGEALESALLGSVANGVVHHSSRPVVVIPAG